MTATRVPDGSGRWRKGSKHDPCQPYGRLWRRGHDPHRARSPRKAHRGEHRDADRRAPAERKQTYEIAGKGRNSDFAPGSQGRLRAGARARAGLGRGIGRRRGWPDLACRLPRWPLRYLRIGELLLGARPLAEDQRRDPRRAGGSEPRRHGPGGGGRRAACLRGRSLLDGSTRHERTARGRAGRRILRGRALQVRLRHRCRGRLRASRTRSQHHPIHLRQEE